jgi:hypothetical protein
LGNFWRNVLFSSVTSPFCVNFLEFFANCMVTLYNNWIWNQIPLVVCPCGGPRCLEIELQVYFEAQACQWNWQLFENRSINIKDSLTTIAFFGINFDLPVMLSLTCWWLHKYCW